MSSTKTRPPRPQRAPAPAMPSFAVLDDTHARALQMLEQFDMLIQHLDRVGLDDRARRSAAEICAFFDGPGRSHHADEERLVFPGLLASGDDQMKQHIHRLQQDHGWIEEDWRELEPHVRSIAENYAGFDLEMLRHALPVFSELYHEHIALEESLIYPEAKRRAAQMQAAADARAASSPAPSSS